MYLSLIHIFGPVLDAWVMLREDRREEAGWLLRKYEKTRFFQLRDSTVRAFFLYVKDLWKQNGEEEFPSLPQVQKLYQKQPDNWHLVLLLMKMDHRLMENTRMSYKLLERQFRAGARNRLIYQAGFELLKKDPALFSTLAVSYTHLYDLQVLRFFMLNAHYRSPLNFSADLMESSKNALERILTAVENLKYVTEHASLQEMTEEEVLKLEETKKFEENFDDSMDDDFNTADAIAAVFDLVKFANTNVAEGSSKAFADALREKIQSLCEDVYKRQMQDCRIIWEPQSLIH